MQLKTTSSLVLALALVCGSGMVYAQAMSKSGKPLTAQQTKMKSCNAEAKTQSLKGPERKTFMSTCLKGDSTMAAAPAAAPMAAAAPMSAKATQQQKMKTCNAEAKTDALKGAARKSFMKTCLSGEAAPAH
ncbi:MAG: PsiF family protein [Dokdonella sp.]